MQSHLSKPSNFHPQSNMFTKDYSIYGLEKILKKYGLIGWRYEYNYLIRKFKNKIKLILK